MKLAGLILAKCMVKYYAKLTKIKPLQNYQLYTVYIFIFNDSVDNVVLQNYTIMHGNSIINIKASRTFVVV